MSQVGSITLAAKVILNVHDLNNETSTGNLVEIRRVDMLDREGRRVEVPAVSGRMIKHWHQDALRMLAQSMKLPLCDGCAAGHPIRPSRLEKGMLKQALLPEDEAVSSCTICDVHGYLITEKGKGASEVTRRSSRAMFSWLLPVLDTEFGTTQVIHSRVSHTSEAGDQSGQMLFSKSYASGVYGMVAAIDVHGVGRTSSGQIAAGDRAQRLSATLEAFRYLLSGRAGSSLAHALPHVDLAEAVITIGYERPLPFPPSPIYPDYLEKLVGALPTSQVRVLGYFEDKHSSLPDAIERVTSLNELLVRVSAELQSA